MPAFPGIHTALARLDKRGVKLGVVTSKARSQTDWTLAQFDVEFATVQTPESALPRQAGAVSAARRGERGAASGVRESVFVGDMDVDAAAAQAAGMRFLHAGWGYGACPDGAEQLRTPRELGEVGRCSRWRREPLLERAACRGPCGAAEALLFVALREDWNGFCSHCPSLPGALAAPCWPAPSVLSTPRCGCVERRGSRNARTAGRCR